MNIHRTSWQSGPAIHLKTHRGKAQRYSYLSTYYVHANVHLLTRYCKAIRCLDCNSLDLFQRPILPQVLPLKVGNFFVEVAHENFPEAMHQCYEHKLHIKRIAGIGN